MRAIFALAFLVLASTQGNAANGCSFGQSAFHRSVFGKAPPWEHCCNTHDRAYARPGTADSRLRADNNLALCVAKTAPHMAGLMWFAVRVGGQPFHPYDWRQYSRDYSTRWQYERDRPL